MTRLNAVIILTWTTEVYNQHRNRSHTVTLHLRLALKYTHMLYASIKLHRGMLKDEYLRCIYFCISNASVCVCLCVCVCVWLTRRAFVPEQIILICMMLSDSLWVSDASVYHRGCIPHIRLLRHEAIVIHGAKVFSLSLHIFRDLNNHPPVAENLLT